MKGKKNTIQLIIIGIVLSLALPCLAAINTESSVSINQAILKINSDEEINSLKIYKNNNGKYVLFYKANLENKSKTVECNIPKTLLSREKETNLKVVINEKKTIDTEIKPLPSIRPTIYEPTATTISSNRPMKKATTKPSTSQQNKNEQTNNNEDTTQNNSSITSIKLNKNRLTMEVGQTEKLTVTTTPQNIKTNITWSTSNNKVVGIEKDGKLVAKGTGTAVVTIKTSNNKSDTCIVTVKKSNNNNNNNSSNNNSNNSETMISKIPYINQTRGVYNKNTKQYEHTDWPFKKLGDNMVYTYGCLLSSAQMILSYYEGNLVTIDSGSRSMYENGGGADKWNVLTTIKNMGYKYSFVNNKTDVDKALDEGKPVIAHIKGNLNGMDYSAPQHFVVIIGKLSNDEYAISDPFSEQNSYIINKKTFKWNEINSIAVSEDYSGAGYPNMKYIVISK